MRDDDTPADHRRRLEALIYDGTEEDEEDLPAPTRQPLWLLRMRLPFYRWFGRFAIPAQGLALFSASTTVRVIVWVVFGVATTVAMSPLVGQGSADPAVTTAASTATARRTSAPGSATTPSGSAADVVHHRDLVSLRLLVGGTVDRTLNAVLGKDGLVHGTLSVVSRAACLFVLKGGGTARSYSLSSGSEVPFAIAPSSSRSLTIAVTSPTRADGCRIQLPNLLLPPDETPQPIQPATPSSPAAAHRRPNSSAGVTATDSPGEQACIPLELAILEVRVGPCLDSN
jgi:hypothetical protein